MSEPVSHSEEPVSGSLELQQALLRQLQTRMSEELFVAGVISRLSGLSIPVTGDQIAINGLNQWGKTFVPALGKPQGGGSRR